MTIKSDQRNCRKKIDDKMNWNEWTNDNNISIWFIHPRIIILNKIQKKRKAAATNHHTPYLINNTMPIIHRYQMFFSPLFSLFGTTFSIPNDQSINQSINQSNDNHHHRSTFDSTNKTKQRSQVEWENHSSKKKKIFTKTHSEDPSTTTVNHNHHYYYYYSLSSPSIHSFNHSVSHSVSQNDEMKWNPHSYVCKDFFSFFDVDDNWRGCQHHQPLMMMMILRRRRIVV